VFLVIAFFDFPKISPRALLDHGKIGSRDGRILKRIGQAKWPKEPR